MTDIATIAKLSLAPGDVLVLRAPCKLSMETSDRIKAELGALLKTAGLSNCVVVLEPGWSFEKIGPDEELAA